MSKQFAVVLEVLLSAMIVLGLLWVAFYLQPTAVVQEIKPSPFGRRENYFGAVVPASSASVIWAVGRKGRIIRSEDLGRNWRIQPAPATKVHLQDIDAWDADNAVIAGDQGTVLVTRNGGADWIVRPLALRQFGNQLLRVAVDHTSDRVWISGSMGSVFLSEDRGETWRHTHPEEDLSWNSITIADDGAIWVVGEFGRMSKSLDQGANWQEVDAGATQSLMDIAFADQQQGVAVGLAGTLLVTADGGESWQPVPDVTELHIYDVAWDGAQYVAVGDGGILLSSADGEHWQAGKLGPDNAFWYTEVVPLPRAASSQRYLAAGATLGITDGHRWVPFLHMKQEPPAAAGAAPAREAES